MKARTIALATSSMLAASAAAAEITLLGEAKLGFSGGSGETTQFYQDLDIEFIFSGQTENGLSFGASVDLSDADTLGNTTGDIGYEVFISGGFGTVTMGDTDSAFQFAVLGTDAWGSPGSIADNETTHWGFQDDWLKGSEDGQVLRYDYSQGDFGFAVSLEMDDASDYALREQGRDRRDPSWGLGLSYAPRLGDGQLKVGLGYETAGRGEIGLGLTDLQAESIADKLSSIGVAPGDALESGLFRYNNSNDRYELVVDLGDNTTNWGGSIGYEMDNGFSFGGVYTVFDGDQLKSGDYWGLGVGYTFDKVSLHANYGEHSFKNTYGEKLDTSGWGLSAGYDLGGGMSVLAGYGNSEATARGDFNGNGTDNKIGLDGETFSLGLSMTF
ncbi:porin [Tropicimonas sp. TH_r6]|uniref:porin n=1 Tax=Tropicimonas sp. TH_r6 TaxID=3082085 RepID=UPI002952E790|nr:porin [Tropicimonas sp. TH_r6]MDV7145571.1 porin [Tropicimonas sp. TH_r6]